MSNVGLYTYSTAALAFLLLTILLLGHSRERPIGTAVFAASLSTCLWAGSIAWGTTLDYPPVGLFHVVELARDGAWIILLLQLCSMQSSGTPWRFHSRRWPLAFIAFFSVAALSITSASWLRGLGFRHINGTHELAMGTWLLISLCGLVLIEQLYRNASERGKWGSKFLCLGIGSIFVYDLFMYAEALLYRQLDGELWLARGIANAVAVPWLAVGITRHRESHIDLHVSREVVFRSFTLVAVGLYLVGMSIAGYFIKYLGGSWGGVLQLGFVAAAISGLLSVIASGRVRAQLRVILSKHFFSYRYDYREEWLKFTETLSGPTENVGEAIVGTMAKLIGAPAGLLYETLRDRAPRLLANWEMPVPRNSDETGNIYEWMSRTGWIIDLPEWRKSKTTYSGLELPDWILENKDIWLLVPLFFRGEVIGILVLKTPDTVDALDWEDRDLLKTAARQAASHLAQMLSNEALLEARQFDAFNRLSAYVVHDLKNILAQQSLMIANAQKHRENPEFIDDMIATVANSVQRMQKLMDQMRSGERGSKSKDLNLNSLLTAVVQGRSRYRPTPKLESDNAELPLVHAEADRLTVVFTHLVQNAQEATDEGGSVRIIVTLESDRVIVAISDTGVGMSEDFIRERLFRPFDSTKGLTGMGIGAFESREYVKQLGGEMHVDSESGVGTTIRVILPTRHTEAQNGSAGHA